MTSGRPSRSSAQHVLVVEDDVTTLRALASALEDEGHTVMRATDGRAALEILKRESARPSVAIVDLIMPLMSGSDLIAALRSMPEFVALPIIVISAMRPRDLPPGVMFVAKPLDIGEICQLVANHPATTR